MLDIYTDPITGLKNLFSLLECDMNLVFGSKGTIVFVDMKRLSMVNENLGYTIGNNYIKIFSELLEGVVKEFRNKWGHVNTFRIGGDEFAIILPAITGQHLNKEFRQIDEELKNSMQRYNFEDAGIRYAIWEYNQSLDSVEELLKQGSLAIEMTREGKSEPGELPQWADDLISKMLLRVKETLALLKQANDMAMYDEISCLANHRAADSYLQEVLQQYLFEKQPFSVLFIDGDNLKRYNELGYKQGNQMIKDLGFIISSSIRSDDKIFRWLSGDEFIVVLKNTTPDIAVKLGKRIRRQVESKTRHWAFPITVSIGIASCPVNGITIDQIMGKAEEANSIAKHSGKNCVVEAFQKIN